MSSRRRTIVPHAIQHATRAPRRWTYCAYYVGKTPLGRARTKCPRCGAGLRGA